MPSHTPGNEPGLETRLLRAWPFFLGVGTVLPMLVAAAIWLAFPDPPSYAEHKQQMQAWYVLAGVTVFYWTFVPTLGAGCWVVRVMKGPVVESDGYPLPKKDLFEM
jgi:RsiW-degrading membrane proteinase PrsW (M82 family)